MNSESLPGGGRGIDNPEALARQHEVPLADADAEIMDALQAASGCLSTEERAAIAVGSGRWFLPPRLRAVWHTQFAGFPRRLGCPMCRQDVAELRSLLQSEGLVPVAQASAKREEHGEVLRWKWEYAIPLALALLLPLSFLGGRMSVPMPPPQVPSLGLPKSASDLSVETVLAWVVNPDFQDSAALASSIRALESFVAKYPNDQPMRLKLTELYAALARLEHDPARQQAIAKRLAALRDQLPESYRKLQSTTQSHEPSRP